MNFLNHPVKLRDQTSGARSTQTVFLKQSEEFRESKKLMRFNTRTVT